MGQPSYHEGEEFEEKYGDKDWYGDDDEDETPTATADREYLKHVVGSVYWDTRSRYLLGELPGLGLAIAPPEIAARVLEPVFRWLLATDQGAFLWFAQNYQSVGLALFLVVFLSRFELDPYES